MKNFLIQSPNWQMLREQKEQLLYTIQEAEENGNGERAEQLTGLLHFIGSIQDNAKESGIWTDEEIFGSEFSKQ